MYARVRVAYALAVAICETHRGTDRIQLGCRLDSGGVEGSAAHVTELRLRPEGQQGGAGGQCMQSPHAWSTVAFAVEGLQKERMNGRSVGTKGREEIQTASPQSGMIDFITPTGRAKGGNRDETQIYVDAVHGPFQSRASQDHRTMSERAGITRQDRLFPTRYH